MDFYLVDCFGQEKYQGNPLAVFVPDRPVSDGEMQQIANEMGFSETAFIRSGRQPDGGYDVRIFTPDTEVPFAGHPVLGAAHVIRTCLGEKAREVRLNLKAGQIAVRADGDCLIMTQNQPEFGMTVEKTALAAALSLSPENIRADYPAQWVSTGLESVIVPLKTAEALRRCRVNHDRLREFHQTFCKCGVLVFVPQETGLRVRVFTDDAGFREDAATGSANGNLAAWLLHHRFFGRSELCCSVSQGSEMGRPSTLLLRAARKDGHYAIEVGGQVHMVARGQWE